MLNLQKIINSACQWNLNKTHAFILLILPILSSILILVLSFRPVLYEKLLREDGIIEWGQFVIYVIACYFCCQISQMCLRKAQKKSAGFFIVIAVLLLIIAGEEISWGQRLLGIRTPNSLQEINKQNELTFHNIGNFVAYFNLGMMIVSAYSIIAYLGYERLGRGKEFWDVAYLYVPPQFLESFFLISFFYKFIRFLSPTVNLTFALFGEWVELCFALGILIFFVVVHKRQDKYYT